MKLTAEDPCPAMRRKQSSRIPSLQETDFQFMHLKWDARPWEIDSYNRANRGRDWQLSAMERSGGRFSRGLLPLLAFQTVAEYYRLPWKPPVTAGLLAANTLIYLRPAFLHPILPSIHEVWFNPYLILKVWIDILFQFLHFCLNFLLLYGIHNIKAHNLLISLID